MCFDLVIFLKVGFMSLGFNSLLHNWQWLHALFFAGHGTFGPNCYISSILLFSFPFAF